MGPCIPSYKSLGPNSSQKGKFDTLPALIVFSSLRNRHTVPIIANSPHVAVAFFKVKKKLILDG